MTVGDRRASNPGRWKRGRVNIEVDEGGKKYTRSKTSPWEENLTWRQEEEIYK